MQGLGNFRDFLRESKQDCNITTTIADINAQYSYEDKIGVGDSLEWDLLSCGQDGLTNGYNKLKRFYNEHISNKFKGLASNQVAIKAFCECYKELVHEQRIHETFKKYVNKKLGVYIK
jgi:hypothetical protein